MSELNNKPINYGALNRFYEDLKSHDLSGLTNYSAGNNIQINNGIISATDTRYSAGSGISINDNNQITCTYQLPTASNDTLGGVKVGIGLSISDGILTNEVGRLFNTDKDVMYNSSGHHILGDIGGAVPNWVSLGVYEWTANNYQISQLTRVSGNLPTVDYSNGLYIRSSDNQINSIMRIEKVVGDVIYLSNSIRTTQSTGITTIEVNRMNCFAYGSSIVLGRGCETQNNSEVALCKYNISHNGTLLSVGCSSGGSYTYGVIRNNAMEIMDNADIYINGIGGYDGVHIKTETGYENTKTLQEYITSLETRIAALEQQATNQPNA